MNGSLEPVSPRFITPKKTRPGETSPDYSPAYPVNVSPVTNVPAAAAANSMQEDFEKKMEQAGKSRRRGFRKSRKSHKKTRKAHKKSRKGKSRASRK